MKLKNYWRSWGRIKSFRYKNKETTYIYGDENVIIKLIINDYSNFKEVNFYVTLEYLTKNLFDEMKANDEHIKA